MKTFKITALVSALALMAGTQAEGAIVADFYTDYVALEATSPAAGSTFSTNGWTLQGDDGQLLVYQNDLSIGNQGGENGWNHPTHTFATNLPATTQGDMWDAGTVTANHISLHGGNTGPNDIDLQIVWTADQDYTDVFVNYFYDRRGSGGAPNSGSSFISIGGTAGVSFDASDPLIISGILAVEDDGVTNMVSSISAGETIVITVAGGAAGEAYGNFQINAVPEPSSLALLGLGGAFMFRRRRS